MPYFSTKTLGPISTSHRQWRANSHCSLVHGYGRKIQFTFACMDLDDKQWVQDFSGLKDIKKLIESKWDHKTLIASDDPMLPTLFEMEESGLIELTLMDVEQEHGPGIEGSCKYIYDLINPIIESGSHGRVWISKVEIWEHENNSAYYTPSMGMC